MEEKSHCLCPVRALSHYVTCTADLRLPRLPLYTAQADLRRAPVWYSGGKEIFRTAHARGINPIATALRGLRLDS